MILRKRRKKEERNCSVMKSVCSQKKNRSTNGQMLLEHRENKLTAKEEHLRQREAKVEELSQKRVQELERISGLTSEQAKEYLLKTVEDDVKHDTAKMVRELETQAKEEADKKAKEYVVNAIQRCAADHVAETTISVVQLPSDEMKGRIIGTRGKKHQNS